jgi:hypothetical protein
MTQRFAPLLCALALALAPGCASGPDKATFVGGNGTSFNSPVIIVCAKTLAEGFAAEKKWLALHYPDAKQTNQQFLALADRRFDVFTLTTADGKTAYVYFDVTDFLHQPPQ